MIEFIAGCFVGVAAAKKITALKEFEFPKLKYKRIVKYGEDKYAVRKGYIEYHYLDLRDGYWWSSMKADRCLGTLEQCKDALKYGEPID